MRNLSHRAGSAQGGEQHVLFPARWRSSILDPCPRNERVTVSAAGKAPRPPQPSRRAVPAIVFAALIIAVGAWAYSTSFAGVLVLDDICRRG